MYKIAYIIINTINDIIDVCLKMIIPQNKFSMNETFHKGELEVQQKAGEAMIARANGRIITNKIPARGAQKFLENQPMVVVSSLDEDNKVWVSPLIGKAGFVSILDTSLLSFNKFEIYSSKKDIFYTNIKKNAILGSIFVELATRRRIKINGRVALANNEIEVITDEVIGNCPKYIQQRSMAPPEDTTLHEKIEKGDVLDGSMRKLITGADTFFIGSKSNHNKLDANHRGGNAGFIKIVDKSTLKIPDYRGNSLFNTLGNIQLNSKTGLLFIDFEKGNILQLTGTSKILFDQHSKEDMIKTGGTGRYIVFNIEKWIVTKNHHKAKWEFLTNSPYNP